MTTDTTLYGGMEHDRTVGLFVGHDLSHLEGKKDTQFDYISCQQPTSLGLA
jgi:hypothetical protein